MNSRFQSLCAPKGSETPKGPKSDPYEIFLFSRWRYPRNHGLRPNFKQNRLKFLHLGPSELSVPKMPLVPNPYFRTEIGNSDEASPEISSRQPSLPSFKSDRHPVPKLWAWVFLVLKTGRCPKSTMPRPHPEFYLGLL